ncbi:MAG: hypothetical protein CVV49_08485 [Spirochaetae bacterium HGW-Spirochaetae-5]|nr:MAG: hypothetical protein CVV49_08485 [Spirochaetae bacterium HGW-Spirochaetae-5]
MDVSDEERERILDEEIFTAMRLLAMVYPPGCKGAIVIPEDVIVKKSKNKLTLHWWVVKIFKLIDKRIWRVFMKKLIILIVIMISIPLFSKGLWDESISTDEITDLVTKVYMTDPGKDFSLIFYDMDNDKSIDYIKFFFFKKYLNNGDSGKMTVRFDKNEPLEYVVYQDGSGAFMTDLDDVSNLLSLMANSKKMIIRIESYDGSLYTESVNLIPLQKKIKVFSENSPLGRVEE